MERDVRRTNWWTLLSRPFNTRAFNAVKGSLPPRHKPARIRTSSRLCQQCRPF